MRGLTHFCLLIFGAIIAENSLLLQVVVVTNCRLVLGEMEKMMGLLFFFSIPRIMHNLIKPLSLSNTFSSSGCS